MPTALFMGLAISKGWSPVIDDTSAELEGDEYPQIPNPVTYQEFLQEFIPEYISEFMVDQGRKQILANFESMKNNIFDSIKKGDFDALILAGDFEGISAAVKNNL